MEDSYGMIPYRVLTDKTISATSKLVFILVNSLAAKDGYCWATNKYIGEQLGIKSRQVTYCLRELEKHIRCEMVAAERRKIYITTPCKKVHTPLQNNAYPPAKNDYHNNIKNNIKNNTASNEIERRYGFRPTVLPPNVILGRN